MFGWEIPGLSFSLPANQDFSNEGTYQWTPVTAVAASGLDSYTGAAAAPIATTGDPIVGILQNNPLLGEAATIVVDGVSKALLAATVTVGQLLMALPSGGFAPCTAGNTAVAQALQAGGAGNIVAVLLVRNGKQ